MKTDPQKHYRSCNLCEAICGLVIEHDGTKVLSIKGDPDDPLSKGHICPKAIALQDVYEDPNRLRQPIERTEGGWQPITWEQAFEKIEQRFVEIQTKHGNDSIAMYLGNPTVHNYGAMLFQRFLGQALKTKHRFSATSVDQLPHHMASSLMFGHSLLIPVPDIDHTQHMLILGANPIASNGSMMTAPGIRARMKAVQQRGGKLVLVDPRATETAKLVNEHHFIHPGTDAFLLAALLHIIFDQKLENLDQCEPFSKHLDQLRDAVHPFTPRLAALQTGIAEVEIIRMATEFAEADRAVCYGRIGLSTQVHGGICQWLVNALNLITGNLDRKGGQMFTLPAVDVVGKKSTTHRFGRWRSSVRSFPEIDGELPVSVLAEEIRTSGQGSIRALITNAGNPVLSTPNGRQLDEAFSQLEFMVSIDIYLNESTRHANIILPPATGIETDHYDLAFNALAVRNVAKYSPPLFKPSDNSRYDWQIFRELSQRLWRHPKGIISGIKSRFNSLLLKFLTPLRILKIGISIGPYGRWKTMFGKNSLTLNRLKQSPHGIDLGPLLPRLPGLLLTADQKIDTAPAAYVNRLKEIASDLIAKRETHKDITSFALIGRRHLRSNNSWMHNYERLIKGKNRCTLLMHSTDAAQLELENGMEVIVTSRIGEVRIPLETTTDIMPGVVSIPHGYGHNREGSQISIAEMNPGVSINDLTDDQIIDELTGNAAFSGQRVTVQHAS
ncbi:MAG: molybdopterin-dependent oxidoreductase [Gimesia sp.]